MGGLPSNAGRRPWMDDEPFFDEDAALKGSRGSWVEIVEVGMVGSGFIKTGAVLSWEGVQYCGTPGFKLYAEGIRLKGTKYVAVSANPRSIHCRSGSSGLLCTRAKDCVLIGLYKPPVSCTQATLIIEGLADEINDGLYQTDQLDDSLLANLA